MLRNTCFRLGLSAVFAIAVSAGAAADPLEDGQAAYNRGDFSAAQELWRPLAEQGVARAQNNLGVLYENGKGFQQNLNEALKWYRLAAEQGYAGAWNNLGLIYALGRGAPRDPFRAYMWFDLAASSLSGDLGKSAAESRDVVASTMTSQQIEEASDMSRKCQASNYKQCERAGGAAALASLTPPAPNGRTSATIDLSSSNATYAVATTSHDVKAEDYPAEAIRRHETGDVTVTYVVSETGAVATCSVLVTSGSMRLDDAACAMVKKRWKYKPATQDGKPVSIQYISKVSFPPR